MCMPRLRCIGKLLGQHGLWSFRYGIYLIYYPLSGLPYTYRGRFVLSFWLVSMVFVYIYIHCGLDLDM
jgi:hypothetical protein